MPHAPAWLRLLLLATLVLIGAALVRHITETLHDIVTGHPQPSPGAQPSPASR